ncbi:hypothetical protein FACS1894176_00890 [Bacteroidia bacterium]|nr:hypothetical protein FACS1894176_00890 [Bacteroidia bacterium]
MKKNKVLSLLLCLTISATAIAKTEVIQKGAFVLSEDYTKIEFPVKQQIGDVFSILERNGDVILWTLSLKGVGELGTVTLGTRGGNDTFVSEGEMKLPLVKESSTFEKVYYKAEVRMKKGKTLFGEGMVYSFEIEKKASKADVVKTWELLFTLILLVLFEFLLFTRIWTKAVQNGEELGCFFCGVVLTGVTMLLWIFSGAWFPLELGIYLILIGGLIYYMWGTRISSYYQTKKREARDKRVADVIKDLSL